MYPPPVAVELDAFEHAPLRLLPRLAALAVHQLALERLEEGFRERVVPWAARPRHGSGDSMGLEAALQRPERVLGALIVVEDEAEALGRALPFDCLLERIRDRLLGHAPEHRPARDLPAERVDHGCEAGQSFARPDAGDVARPWLVAGFDVERPVHEVHARVAHLPVLPCPPPERRILDSELPRKVGGPHLAAKDHPCRRYLELLIVTLPFLGAIEHLSPLTWCPRNLTLSKLPNPKRSRISITTRDPKSNACKTWAPIERGAYCLRQRGY